MFKIQIKTEDYQPILLVLGDWNSIWSVYWLFITSVQNMNDTFMVNVTDLRNDSYVDITKGGQGSPREYIDTQWITVKKNTNYIKSIVYGKLIEDND